MARYYADQALGMLETVGMVPALEACDKMLKAAEVELISYENVGSTLVTIFVKGDVGAVQSAVKAGAEAAKPLGKLTATKVIPRPIKEVGEIVSIYDIDTQCDPELVEPGHGQTAALGIIETFGIVFCIEAADAMCKAADVELVGFENTASGYISALVSGDVGACRTAVEAGLKTLRDMGNDAYSSIVIPRPHEDLKKITCQYSLDKLLP